MGGGCWTTSACNVPNATDDPVNNTDSPVHWIRPTATVRRCALNAPHACPPNTTSNSCTNYWCIGNVRLTNCANQNERTMPTIPKHDTNWKPKEKQTGRRHDEPRYNTTRWRRLRAAFLAQFPICDQCGRMATVVDHVLQVSKGGDFWNGPFRPLCKRCHDTVSARQRHDIDTPSRRKYSIGDGGS